MLSNDDFNKLEKLLDKKLEEKLEKQLKPVRHDLDKVKTDQVLMLRDISNLKLKLEEAGRDLFEIRKDHMQTKRDFMSVNDELVETNEKIGVISADIKQIKKVQKRITNFFDRENLDLTKRVKRVEEYLKLPAIY